MDDCARARHVIRISCSLLMVLFLACLLDSYTAGTENGGLDGRLLVIQLKRLLVVPYVDLLINTIQVMRTRKKSGCEIVSWSWEEYPLSIPMLDCLEEIVARDKSNYWTPSFFYKNDTRYVFTLEKHGGLSNRLRLTLSFWYVATLIIERNPGCRLEERLRMRFTLPRHISAHSAQHLFWRCKRN